MSLREKLTKHLREGLGIREHGALATPSNISRRLRELEVDGVLEVQIRKGHAHYRLAQKVPTLFQ
jgi:DNA-binding HxlR family transcriptional regulator